MPLSLSSALPAAWASLTTSAAAQVFASSTCVLLAALALEVWLKAVRLTGFDALDLREVEFTHPHLPSLRVIAGAFLCSTALLMVSLLSYGGIPLFRGPYQSLYPLALFTLSAALGAVGELRWPSARDGLYAFVTGTAVAFLALTAAVGGSRLGAALLVCQLAALGACLVLAHRLFYRSWSPRVRLLLLATVAGWLLLFLAT